MFRRLIHLYQEQLRGAVWYYVVALFLLIACLTCGITCACRLGDAAGAQRLAASVTVGLVFYDLFREAWCFGLVAACLVHWLGIAVAACALCVRAYAVGFAWGWCLAQYGFGGLPALLLLLPAQGFMLLMLLSAVCAGAAHALGSRRLHARGYLQMLLGYFVLALVSLPLEWIAIALL